jgi:hypothetical protein
MLATDRLAEGVGFEPTIRFPVYTLSKRAPSATRPSLRRAGRTIAAGFSLTTKGIELPNINADPAEAVFWVRTRPALVELLAKVHVAHRTGDATTSSHGT